MASRRVDLPLPYASGACVPSQESKPGPNPGHWDVNIHWSTQFLDMGWDPNSTFSHPTSQCLTPRTYMLPQNALAFMVYPISTPCFVGVFFFPPEFKFVLFICCIKDIRQQRAEIQLRLNFLHLCRFAHGHPRAAGSGAGAPGAPGAPGARHGGVGGKSGASIDGSGVGLDSHGRKRLKHSQNFRLKRSILKMLYLNTFNSFVQ